MQELVKVKLRHEVQQKNIGVGGRTIKVEVIEIAIVTEKNLLKIKDVKVLKNYLTENISKPGVMKLALQQLVPPL